MANAYRVWQLTGTLTLRSVSINIATAALNTLPVWSIPRGFGRGDGYGYSVATFLDRADTATRDVAAKILGFLVANLCHNSHSEMSFPIHYGGMWVGGLDAWLPWRMRPASERPVWQWAQRSVF
jgi:hypothetical protein